MNILGGLLAVVVVAYPTEASGGGGGHGGSNSGPSNRIRANFEVAPDVEDGGADGRTTFEEAGPRGVDIPVVALPVFADDTLISYLFVNVRVIVAEGVDPWSVRENAHKIRDAFIRAGHRRSISSVETPERIDPDTARAVLLEGLYEVVDRAKIERIEFTNVDAHAG